MSNTSCKMPLRIFISIWLILILKLNISPIEVSVELPFYKVSHRTFCGWLMPFNVFSKYLSHQVLLSRHTGSLRLTTVNYELLFRGKVLKSSVVMPWSGIHNVRENCAQVYNQSFFFSYRKKPWNYVLNTNPGNEIQYL